MSRILVTGATGRTGGQVAAQLLAAGYPLRAYVRREDARSAALKAAGAEIATAAIVDAVFNSAAFVTNVAAAATSITLAANDAAGVTACATVAEAVRGAERIHLSLADDASVDAVLEPLVAASG